MPNEGSLPLSLLLLGACTPGLVDGPVVDQVIPTGQRLQLIEEIEKLPNSLARLSYQKLSPSEKVILWQRHLQEWLDSSILRPEQKAHIRRIYEFANVELYENREAPETKRKLADAEETLFYQPIRSKLFPAKLLLQIATFDGVGKATNTNATEAFCNCYYSISCGAGSCVDRAICTSPGPKPKDTQPSDCGLLGSSDCSGRCDPN